jgi:hypothetical protein
MTRFNQLTGRWQALFTRSVTCNGIPWMPSSRQSGNSNDCSKQQQQQQQQQETTGSRRRKWRRRRSSSSRQQQHKEEERSSRSLTGSGRQINEGSLQYIQNDNRV